MSISQVNIKVEPAETSKAMLLEKPIVLNEPASNGYQKITIKTEVASDDDVDDGDEATNHSLDEIFQCKIEFEDTQLQSEGDPTADRANKVAEEDRLIEDFFGLNCETCSKPFDSLKSLRMHTRKTHSKKLAFTCCNKRYYRRALLLEHIAFHNNPQPARSFQCDSCDKAYKRKTELENHRLIAHHGEEARPFKCKHCVRSYPKQHLLNTHMARRHDRDESRCDICSQVFANRRTMQMHATRVHVEGAHECDVCGRKFKRKLLLTEHYAIHTGEKLYKCNLCGLQMNSSSNLYTHRRKKHPKEWAERKQKEL